MYAVIETGGKQYRVEVGTELAVDLLDVEPGQAITFDRVLLVGDGDATAVGQPLVADAAVEAEVVRRDRGEKLIVFKYRPKARRRVKKGHRQDHLVLRVTDVKLNGRSAADERSHEDDAARTERQRLEEAAARQAAADAELAARLADRSETEPAKATSTRARKATTKTAADAETSDADAATDDAPTAKASTRRPSRARADADAAPDADADAATADETTTPDEPAAKRGRTKKD